MISNMKSRLDIMENQIESTFIFHARQLWLRMTCSAMFSATQLHIALHIIHTFTLLQLDHFGKSINGV